MLTLYQFTGSHYCEKAQWALDWKGVPYKTDNLVVGLHAKKVRKLAPNSSVPVLVDGGQAVQGSGAIISHLDDRYPEDPLTPAEPDLRRKTMEWESFLDDRLGVPIRLYLYHHILPDREAATRYLLTGTPWWARPIYRIIFPGIREAMIRMMKITPASAERAKRTLDQTLQNLNQALDDRDFLVGDRFSRADLTASALLSGVLLSSRRLPPVLDWFYCEIEDQRCFQWTVDMYRRYRRDGRSAP